jgi:2-hydroxy-6-oxonona-2,4-dienedioate hydrolase
VRGLGLICNAGVRLPGEPPLTLRGVPSWEFEQRAFFQPELVRALQTEETRAASQRARELYDRLGRVTPRMNFYERLSEVSVPTLVLWGRHDRVIPLEIGEATAAGIPGARLVVVEEAAHVPQIEQAREVSSRLADFLRTL